MRVLLPIAILLLIPLPFLSLLLALSDKLPPNFWEELTYKPFVDTINRSGRLFLVTGIFAILTGWPLGNLLAFVKVRMRWLLILSLLLPITLPPFVLAIGVQSLKHFTSFRNEVWFDGFSGCVLTSCLILIPIVALVTFSASRVIHQSEVEAVFLHRGPAAALFQLMRSTFPSAFGAVCLGVLLLISDSGSGQLMGVHGIAREILIEFSANHDIPLALLKSMALFVLTLPIAAAGALLLSRSFSFRSDARGKSYQSISIDLFSPSQQLTIRILIALSCLAFPITAVFGILTPLITSERIFGFEQAFDIFRESFLISFGYGISSAAIACALGFFFVYFLPRHLSPRAKQYLLTLMIVLLAIPAIVSALGMNWLVSQFPKELDLVFRSPFLVSLGCGLRFTPLAVIFVLPAWERTPRSQRDSLELSPMKEWRKIFCVVFPALRTPLAAAFAMTALLSLSDATSLAFLQPPGRTSFGSHLFAMMDNTPQQVIACMCLLYFVVPILILAGAATAWRERSRI